MSTHPVNLAEVLAVLAAFSPVVYKVMDFLKLLFAGETRPAITQVVVWGVGILVAFLGVKSNLGGLSSINYLNWASVLLVGLSLGSVGSVINDFKQARDNTDSAAKPPLLKPPRKSK